MSDDRKYELPPFVQNDDSATMIAHFAARRRRAYAAVLASTSPSEVFEPFPPRVEAATASLLLQAVIVPGARTGEGRLIEAVIEPWFEIIALLQKDPNIAFQLSSTKWEEMIAGVYKESGFDEVILTPRSGDYGRDVIATISGVGFYSYNRFSESIQTAAPCKVR